MVVEIAAIVLYLLGVNLARGHYPAEFQEFLNQHEPNKAVHPIALWMCILLWPLVEAEQIIGELRNGE